MPSFSRFASFAILLAGLGAIGACQRNSDQGTPAPEAAPSVAPAAEAPASGAAPGMRAQGDDQPPEGVLRAYVWQCDDGSTLAMKNLFRENAITLQLHEGPRRLNQVPSASGAKYADQSITFWTKGGTARFERKGNPAVNCREIRAQSILADARARGVDYRGTGNEPGWLVEAGPGNRLLFVTNFGQERHELDGATIRNGPETNVVIYEADRGADRIQATFRRAPCADDMSGQEFDHVVVVAFGGQELRGCGTALR
jgi:putative lipoprotein